MIIVAALLFCIYFLIGFFEDRKFKIPCAVLFVVLSCVLKFSIDITKTADYNNYYDFLLYMPEQEFSLKMFFTEPYFYQLGSWFYRHYSVEQSLAFFFEFSFIFTTVFFVWLAFLKNVSTFNKIIIFSLYYYFFAYIILRNAPAYMLTGVGFYYLHRNKYLKVTALSFLAHLSSLPVIFFSVFKNKLGDKKLVLMCILFIIFFNVLLRIELFGIYDKFVEYSEQTVYGQSIFHEVYFIVFILLNIYLFFVKRDIVFNYTYLLIFVTYLVLNYTQSVMGYRFSIYLILYLAINPKFNYSISAIRKFLYLMPIFFGLSLLNYLTLQI